VKKLINNPRDVVHEMVDGLVALFPGLARLSSYNVLLRSDTDAVRDTQVAVISGGGSGHEPAHAGYIGAGMLTAAVAGEVFTSPSVDSIYAAIKTVAGKQGVLLIVKNYTGDRLNFGLAAEMARAEGIQIETVVVADDIALAQMAQKAGRRGIAGTVLIHKIAGASAAEGKILAEIKEIAAKAAEEVATMGVSLSPGIVPSIGKPNFELGENEIELGLGIHGEPGVERVPLETADVLVDRLVEQILSVQKLEPSARAVLMINNLGATTQMEIAVVARRAVAAIEARGIHLERIYAGTFMSSLETAGISLSFLPVDDDRLRWLDAQTTAPAWPRILPHAPSPVSARTVRFTYAALPAGAREPAQTAFGKALEHSIRNACDALIEARGLLTVLDQAVGDGDLGISMARGAKAVKAALMVCPLDDPETTLRTLALTLQSEMGGSSGPLYGIFFLRAATALHGRIAGDALSWVDALKEGCDAIRELGGAEAGDRTMLDALIPYYSKLSEALASGVPLAKALELAIAAAQSGAEATAQMAPKRGRSSYLGARTLGHPDPGAVAVSIWLRAATSSIY
jgi:dihydroxyacetone kinase